MTAPQNWTIDNFSSIKLFLLLCLNFKVLSLLDKKNPVTSPIYGPGPASGQTGIIWSWGPFSHYFDMPKLKPSTPQVHCLYPALPWDFFLSLIINYCFKQQYIFPFKVHGASNIKSILNFLNKIVVKIHKYNCHDFKCLVLMISLMDFMVFETHMQPKSL